ncbi:MAG: Ig-like domain-containing protein [Gemmatimonadaceae bacterium]|nr:Ig-like domain-containing protein [Gemmatimonadaceae bacterium]
MPLLTLAACSSDDDGVGGSSIVEVEIVTVPNNQTLTQLIPGNTRQMLGVPTNSSGNFVDRAVTWVSSNPAAATIDATGLVSAVAGGTTWIRATAGGRTDSISVAVRYPVGTITMAPANPTMRREQAQQMTLTILDTQGNPVTGRTITWASNNAGVTVNATGLVSVGAATADAQVATITATAANASDGGVAVNGTTNVTVMGDAVVATVTITGGTGVDAIGFRGNTGTNTTLVATARSGLGNVIVTPITWSGGNDAVGTVDAGTGAVTFAGGVGNLTVTANATGAGADGANVLGTASFEVAAALTSGAPVTAPDMAGGNGYSYAFDAVGGGFTSFTAVAANGSGDGDLYVFDPGVTNWTTTDGGGSNFRCRSWNSGNGENCAIGTALPGWYRVRLYAWTPAGVVSGMQLTVTGAP